MADTNTTVVFASGHTVEQIDEETCRKISKHFPLGDRFIRLQPGGWFFEENAVPILQKIQQFKLKSSDVFAMTFPKSGTTWMQEILWTFLYNSDLKNPKAGDVLDIRCPHIEADIFFAAPRCIQIPEMTGDLIPNHFKSLTDEEIDYKTAFFRITELTKEPRVMKTHLPISLLPANLLQKSKVVYMARNPRDIIVSRYHFVRLMKFQNFLGNLDDFLNHFINEEVYYNPMWTHLKEAWLKRNHPNLLFLYYEEVVKNPMLEYKKIQDFLGLDLSPDQLKKIVKHTSFTHMKETQGEGKATPMANEGDLVNENVKKETGGFFRKGKVGDWRDNFTEEHIKKINNWIKKQTKDFPDDFPYLHE